MIIRKKKKYEHGGYHEPPEGFTLEDYIRQMYAESRFVRDAGSPAGAAGLAQIMPDTREYMIQRYGLPETVDVYNPQDARTMQRKYMEDLYGRSWNQGTDENKKLKALAAYNYGPTNTIRALERAKKAGYDIYDDTSWTKDEKVLPKETRDYLNRTYFGTDEKFEREYSGAHDKYFDIFPEERPQPKADLQEMPVIEPKIDPQLEQAFKIMGFKGYKNGGVTVKKYEHGGAHPIGEDRIPPSQREREEPPYDPIYGSGARGNLASSIYSQVRQQLADVNVPYAFGPYGSVRGEARLGDMLGVGTDVSPIIGDAKEVVRIGENIKEGNYGEAALGAGLLLLPGAIASKAAPYIRKGGQAVMRFLRPKADEATEAAVSALVRRNNYGPFRPEVSTAELKGATRKEMQEGLDVSNRISSERLSEHLNPEGQRRARQMIVDQLNEYNKYSEADLMSMGLTSREAEGLKRRLSLLQLDDAGNVIPNQSRVDDALDGFNEQLKATRNASEETIQNVEKLELNRTKYTGLKKLHVEAMDAGDYNRAEELTELMDDLDEEHMQLSARMNHLVTGDLRGAYYQPSRYNPHLKLSREFLLNPQSVAAPTAHEFQHALGEVPAFSGRGFREAFGSTVPTDRALAKLKLIDPKNPSIKTSPEDYVWQDLEYFRDTPTERTPFLAEMREDMLEKGFINHRQQEVSEDLMDAYLNDYYKNRDLLSPSTATGKDGVRILEIMDPSTGNQNRGILKESINKMLIAVPAVGAGAAALSNGNSEFGKGGKFKVRKYKGGGYMVRKK